MTSRTLASRTLASRTLASRTLAHGVAAVAVALALTACGGAIDPLGDDQPAADGIGTQPEADQGLDDQEPPATSGMCAEEEPDCMDTVTSRVCAPSSHEECNDTGLIAGDGDVAAGSCLAGDADCTDESYGGPDMIPLTDTPSDAVRIERGATSGATERTVTAAHLIHDTTLELTFEGGACDRVEDVVVEENPGQVRILVLSGMDAAVEMCTMQIVSWSIEVQLDEPLGGRSLLDLAR